MENMKFMKMNRSCFTTAHFPVSEQDAWIWRFTKNI